MKPVIYVQPNGDASDFMLIHSGHYGEVVVGIIATGITEAVVDWQITGKMFCTDVTTRQTTEFGLIWDESRILTDCEGGSLSNRELLALEDAGFNTGNFR